MVQTAIKLFSAFYYKYMIYYICYSTKAIGDQWKKEEDRFGAHRNSD